MACRTCFDSTACAPNPLDHEIILTFKWILIPIHYIPQPHQQSRVVMDTIHPARKAFLSPAVRLIPPGSRTPSSSGNPLTPVLRPWQIYLDRNLHMWHLCTVLLFITITCYLYEVKGPFPLVDWLAWRPNLSWWTGAKRKVRLWYEGLAQWRVGGELHPRPVLLLRSERALWKSR